MSKHAHSTRVEKTRRRFKQCVTDAGGPTAAAFRLGLSLSTVNSISSGERDPGLDVAFRIQKMFGIAAEEWLDERHVETVKRLA